MALSKQFIADNMEMKIRVDGSVNGRPFTIEGTGNGQPYEGKQTAKFKVTKGAPLPFSFDILSTVVHYGNRCFTKYPDNIPDYFKNAFPAGMSFERSFTFEDGGVATAHGDISTQGKTFIQNCTFHGVNFPEDGPIMKKETIGWDPSFEKMTVRDGKLRGDFTMFLLLEGGGFHKCQFHTTYKTKQPVPLPPNHVVEHHIVRTDLDKAGNNIQLDEHAVAHVNPL